MGKIIFKPGFDIMQELKSRGYNPQRIRNEKILSQGTLTGLRRGVVPLAMLPVLCDMLGLQPGSFLRHVPDEKKTE